jgi:hypothetical protein
VEDLEAFKIMRRDLDVEAHLIGDLLDLTPMAGGSFNYVARPFDFPFLISDFEFLNCKSAR